jgi:hypothetical protein
MIEKSRYPYTLGFRISSEQEAIVKNLAYSNNYTLGQAGRAILDAGIRALGLAKQEGEFVDHQ